MKVCVIGLGYIGLPTATLAATAGHQVIGADTNPSVVMGLNSGIPHIVGEPGLEDLFSAAVKKGNLRARETVTEADVFLVAVPTPITETKTADLSYVIKASRSVVPFMRRGALFIVESTIPPGCTDDVIVPILEESGLRAGVDFYVAHCPERVIPGNVVHELVYNDRVIGGLTPESAERAGEFYKTFVKGDICLTGLKEAELTKLAENSYRDVNIAFANELALISERMGINPREVVRLANRHPRVNVLNPGPGVGGHCISVDPWFLVEMFPEEARLLRAARCVNDHRPYVIADQVMTALEQYNIEKPVVACLGLTYKANVSDMRESPSIHVLASLANNGCEVRVCDPYAGGDGSKNCVSVEEAVTGADALVLLVDHDEYKSLNVEALRKLMRHPVVLDTRGVWEDQGIGAGNKAAGQGRKLLL